MDGMILYIGARVVSTSLPGSFRTPIFLRALDCRSSEHTNILDCESDLGITKCSHNQDVVVHCEGKQCLMHFYYLLYYVYDMTVNSILPGRGNQYYTWQL
jgi:hypothetical protein